MKEIIRWNKETVSKYVSKMIITREKFYADINNYHVKIQKGNTKTGTACWTVSLLPIVDCKNCSHCSPDCYDLRHDLIYTPVLLDRAKNSAIHKLDIARYWSEINQQIKANFITELRINVGGDLNYEDFGYVNQIGTENPGTMILFFTKNYEDINKWISENGEFVSNIKPIMSAWLGVEMKNPYNLPESHVLWSNGKTTAPKYGAYYCGGNCTGCAFKGEGCWTLKHGEHVIFKAH